MIFHNIHVNSFTFSLLVLYLFITHPSFFFIFPQVVRIPFKFINHVLQANESFLNGSNFPSFHNLCIRSGPSLGKMSKQFQYKYRYQRILIFSVIWLGMMQLKYNSFDTDIRIQIM